MKKSVVLIIAILILVCAIATVLLLNKKSETKNNGNDNDMKENYDNTAETGNWKAIPSSFDEISTIEIRYDGGNELIDVLVSDNIIYYRAYDDEGMQVKKTNSITIPSDFGTYFMNNVIPKIKNTKQCYQKKEYYEISATLEPTGYFRFCQYGEEPDWFKNLLNKLEVDKYGYIRKNS